MTAAPGARTKAAMPTDPPSPQPQPRLSLAKRVGIAVFFLLFIVDAIFRRSNLVDPLPGAVTLVSALVGVVAILPLANRVEVEDVSFASARRAWLLVSFLAVGAFAGPYVVRGAWVTAAFLGVKPHIQTTEASVRSRFYGTKSGNLFAEVDFGQDTRQIRVEVSDDLYNLIDPARFPGRDCLSLEVETGRFGVRRVLLPAPLNGPSLGTGTYRRCQPKSSATP